MRTLRASVTRHALFVTMIALIATLLVVGVPGTESVAPANAANASDFRDGNLISDQNFFDSGSMSPEGVQSFLEARVPSCRGANGQPCVKDYWQDTQARSPDAYCGALPGGRMSGAQIIVAAARACGISPKVLIVMLQKEQGIITDSSPTSWSYAAALGQSCPDNAACDPAYAGFFNQVFFGARQMRMYIAKPQWYAYQLGWNDILYNPNRDCGTKRVNIVNDATRALYIYTPYTPNTAALANLYGTGDSCSTYGNRNFWRLYSDWFGDPTSSFEVRGDIRARWVALGSASGVLGSPVADEVCNWAPGVVNCYQDFANGAISWTPKTGAWETYGAIRQRWIAITAERSELGYPVAAPFCGTRGGGCYQNFEKGAISWTPWTGAWETFGGIREKWLSNGAENGVLGYPTSEVTCTSPGVCQQPFENGTVVATPSALTGVYGAINVRWHVLGGVVGMLGTPTAAESCTWSGSNGVCAQPFSGGAITWTTTTGAWETSGAVHSYWAAAGAESGALGAPVEAPKTSTGSVVQRFQWGAIGSSAAGTFRVLGSMNARWQTLGDASSVLGAPRAEEACFFGASTPNCYQNFQGGAISWTASTGAWETYGVIRARWLAIGFESGVLGYPTGAVTCRDAGTSCYQTFQNGAIDSSAATGTWETYGVIRARWAALGYQSGTLGLPKGPVSCGNKDGGCFQDFQNGAISWTSRTGVWETYGPIRSYWSATDYERGPLGYPTSAVTTAGSESRQSFEGGTVVHDAATGVTRKL